MLGCFLFALHICSVYLHTKLPQCTAPKCTGTTGTGNFEDVIISLTAAQAPMLIMYLPWNICYLLYGLYVTMLIYEDELKFLLVGHFLVWWASV